MSERRLKLMGHPRNRYGTSGKDGVTGKLEKTWRSTGERSSVTLGLGGGAG